MSDEGATVFAEPREKTILIVDDDEIICELLEFIVQREGFKFETVADGEAALGKILNHPPDLILLDMMLPRRGGYEVLKALQTEPETSRIPIIIFTGRYSDHTTSDMIRQESNVVEYLTKPLNAQALVLSLHRHLKTKPPVRPDRIQG